MHRPSNVITLNNCSGFRGRAKTRVETEARPPISWCQDVSQVNSVQGIWAVSPRHVDLSFPGAFNKAIVSWQHLQPNIYHKHGSAMYKSRFTFDLARWGTDLTSERSTLFLGCAQTLSPRRWKNSCTEIGFCIVRSCPCSPACPNPFSRQVKNYHEGTGLVARADQALAGPCTALESTWILLWLCFRQEMSDPELAKQALEACLQNRVSRFVRPFCSHFAGTQVHVAKLIWAQGTRLAHRSVWLLVHLQLLQMTELPYGFRLHGNAWFEQREVRSCFYFRRVVASSLIK